MTTGKHPDDGHTESRQLGTSAMTGSATASTAAADSLAYPISPDYVQSWTPVRALCELIANALDEDRDATVGWAGGVLTIADDGPGIPEEGMILGHSTKTAQQIGQFGEGKKLACLVLARSPEVGPVRCETVGYGFVPSVKRRRLLEGLIPSLSGQGAEVLVYDLHRNDRSRGTVFTVACTQALAEEAIGRFRALREPGYAPPAAPGTVVLAGEPGRVWIGGVLVSTVPGLLASYDLPLDDKQLQNRDRTVIEAGALRDAVRTILAANDDPQVIERFATHVLAGGKLREPEQFFSTVHAARPRAAWRTWGRVHLPANAFYASSRQEEAVLDLQDKAYTRVTASGLSDYQEQVLMALLGVEVARVRQQRHYERTRNTTTWVPDKTLTTAERDQLTAATALVCRMLGPFALDRVRVYSDSEQSPCADGFYTPNSGDVAVHRHVLTDRHRTLAVLFHEAGHRVRHRGGGRWIPSPDYSDRSRGFESMLTEFGGLLLGLLADVAASGSLPEPATPQQAAEHPRRVRLAAADDPAVPASRRDLAHLLLDRLPHALRAGGFTGERDLVASTAVRAVYWQLLTQPRPAGFRRGQGVSTAWDYDKVALLAEAAGVHPPVVWLASNLCEGPLHGRRRDQWGKPGRWAKQVRDHIDRACTDLETLGGAYAAHIPALRALADGTTPAPTGDDRWHEPARALVALERQRLHLDDQQAG
ncbi:ATP-binding protein [Dactylosporangium matsuzakiense]|uniref:Uncharacterized protein n=1 Tax=Dactylosporangium matsuzakiense TaxID=53360 RepID=A0A9W6NQ26_9ACTN|nr:ATP-binding protein [Dactylosporangium matsuzakiense]UWZ44652.1 hypothetical protein Dmats_46190 [Dactylosporangium matsuzakiense]GLL04662.1 hypothetical protein GCM10017581_064090 [Dactylosporangium matsuzakiense]